MLEVSNAVNMLKVSNDFINILTARIRCTNIVTSITSYITIINLKKYIKEDLKVYENITPATKLSINFYSLLSVAQISERHTEIGADIFREILH